MRCMNCGLPLSPSRTMTNCPRCGASLNAFQGAQQQQQFEQAGWEGSMGGASQQNPWGQGSPPSSTYGSFPQQNPGGLNSNRAGSGFGGGLDQAPFSSRRLYAPPKSKSNPRLLFIVAGLFVFLAAMLLGLVYVLGASNSGNSSTNTASTGANTASAGSTATPAVSTPTVAATTTPDTNASPTGTAYPGQQYIDSAQMGTGVDKTTLSIKNPTTTFKAGSTMYVTFKLHPPSQGGAFCVYWYEGGKQITQPYSYPVKSTSRGSYAYATYGQAGTGYVELYWASSTSCSDQTLAQHVDFTVTA